MRKILLLFVLASVSCFAQNKVEITASGVTPIVTEIDHASTELLYSKTMDWINSNYKSPGDVIMVNKTNEVIRVQGFSRDFFFQKSLGSSYYDVVYSIEFSFKEGKYRFNFFSEEITSKGQKMAFLTSPADFFKKDGTPKGIYKSSIDSFSEAVTKLYLSHYNFVSGISDKSADNW